METNQTRIKVGAVSSVTLAFFVFFSPKEKQKSLRTKTISCIQPETSSIPSLTFLTPFAKSDNFSIFQAQRSSHLLVSSLLFTLISNMQNTKNQKLLCHICLDSRINSTLFVGFSFFSYRFFSSVYANNVDR